MDEASPVPDGQLDDGTLEALERLGAATLYEASGTECFLPSRLRPVWKGASIVGTALPVTLAAGDNLPLHLALEVAVPGDVLVVDGGNAPYGYWGEVLTAAAQTAGIAGLIIDGGVRDTRELAQLEFPVFSSHVALRGTAKTDPGRVGAPIVWGETIVGHGDVIVADADGIVCIRRMNVTQVIHEAQARVAQERNFISRLRSGATTIDLYGFHRQGSARE